MRLILLPILASLVIAMPVWADKHNTDHSAHGAPAGGAHAGHDMTPLDASAAPMAPPEARGNRLLAFKLVDGVKEYELEVGLLRWHILPEVMVSAMAYNGQVPGPLLRFTPGDRVRIKVTNKLSEPTTVHWHGVDVPIGQDGVPDISHPPIAPGATHAYEYTVPNTPGTFFYHTHFAPDRQQALGLYGPLIIDDPKQATKPTAEHLIMLGEWRIDPDGTRPAMDADGMKPNYFTLNGKAHPLTETLTAKVGDRLLFRVVGSGQFIHPIHLHGAPFKIVGTDGHPVPEAQQLIKDTILVGPGERYDLLWTPNRPGKWMLHCHINHHTTNDHREDGHGGGMMMIIDVQG